MNLPQGKLSSEILDKLPPSDVPTEIMLVGAMLLQPSLCDSVPMQIEATDFYADANRVLFARLLSIWQKHRSLDIALVRQALKESGEFERIGGAAYLGEAMQEAGLVHNASHYSKIIKDKSRLRQVLKVATELLQAAWEPSAKAEDIVGIAEQNLLKIKTGDYQTDPVSLDVASMAALDWVDQLILSNKSGGIQTGLDMLDYETGGVYPGEVTVLAARTGQGKTTLALQIAHNMATAGIPVYYASLEMNRMQVALKNLCRIAQVSIKAVRAGRINNFMRAAMIDALEHTGIPLHIHDWPKIRPFDIARAARKIGAGVIFVDYLQRVKPTDSKQKRWEQVGQISDDIKTVAGELQIPVIAVAQLNRESDKEKFETRPKLSHLRESGNLEQDADQVWLLWRPENGINGPKIISGLEQQNRFAGEHWPAELKVSKHRFGDVQTIRLETNTRSASFSCTDTPPQPEENCYAHDFDEQRAF